jgi:mevalonate kinase
MKLKLVIAISALAAMMPAFAQAKQGETPPNAPTSTMAQVQKVIQIISGNKTKLQQYCEIATKLDPQIAEAMQKNDPNKLEKLVTQANDLADKIGPEYVAMMDGLPQIDDNSREGKQITAALDSLDKLCATK